tara:strand:+ start:2084 stop:2257 length:174 start_codon:yes stop_codon:yes gene_type:complete
MQSKEDKVKKEVTALQLAGLTVDDYLQSQLDEYIAGRMTHKMMMHMLNEFYVAEENL